MKREPLQPPLPSFMRDALPGENGDLAPPAWLQQALALFSPADAAPPSGLRRRLLVEIERAERRFAPFFDALERVFDLDDLALEQLFRRAALQTEWSPTPIPGAFLFHLSGGPRVAAADNGLLRLAAGHAFPAHTHLGVERVLVLEGGYIDQASGRVLVAGDEDELAAGSSHAYRALDAQPLLLAVSLCEGIDVAGLGRLGSPRWR